MLINPGEGWLLYAVFGMYGLTAYPIYAIAVAHANDFAKDGQFAKIASGMLLVLGIGLATGPIFASYFMTLLGPVGMFVVTASFHGVLAAFALLRLRMRQSPPTDGRAPFQAVPLGRHSTPETFALDPRAEDSASLNRPDGKAKGAA